MCGSSLDWELNKLEIRKFWKVDPFENYIAGERTSDNVEDALFFRRDRDCVH